MLNLDLYVCCFDALMSRGPSRGPNNLYVYVCLWTTAEHRARVARAWNRFQPPSNLLLTVPRRCFSHRISGNLKLLREPTNVDRKRLKITFSIANCRFRLPICNLKRCFDAYRPALLDSRDSLRLPPIRCGSVAVYSNCNCLPASCWYLTICWYRLG